jgi:hypothetical protein
MMATSDSAAVLLPVAQFKETHDLKLDPDLIPFLGATVVAPPYQAMAVGDKVILSVKLYFGDEYFGTEIETRILTATDIGQPIQWMFPQAVLQSLLEGDHIEVSYSIVYSAPTVNTDSEEQTLIFDPTPAELLPHLSIKGFNGDTLDPEDYPTGITLTVEPYPGMQLDDYVLLYAAGETRVIKAIRVDQTTIDSRKLEIPLGYEWLAANNGNEVSLMYQYARLGSAGSSKALSLMLRKPLKLPPPIIVGVIREGEDDEFKGYLLGRMTTNGITIDLPEDAVIGPNDKVQMVFDGFKPGGDHVADPTFGNTKRFQIPKRYVPANLGKRLPVFYQVALQGKSLYKSKRFDLHITNMEGWPTVQIISPTSPNNVVSLKAVSDAVIFNLKSWTFMAEGQRVRIVVTGVAQAGGTETFNLRKDEAERLTEDEFHAGLIEATLPRAFLIKLVLNLQFEVTVDISFDGGFSYKPLPKISPQLVE